MSCMKRYVAELDYQPLFGKWARAPPYPHSSLFSGRNKDPTRESGGNQAYYFADPLNTESYCQHRQPSLYVSRENRFKLETKMGTRPIICLEELSSIVSLWTLPPPPGGHSTKFYMGRLRPTFQPPTLSGHYIPFLIEKVPLLYTFHRKWYSFHIPDSTYGAPFAKLLTSETP